MASSTSFLRCGIGVGGDGFGLGENIHLRSAHGSPVMGQRSQWHLGESVGSADQSLRLARMQREATYQQGGQ